ncbi:MAG: uL30 family ribosomal protein [Nanoarchaeota archaeon]
MIIAIRIAGTVEIESKVEMTLSRLRMRKKYSAVLLKNNPESLELLRKVRDFVAFGVLSEADIEDLISKRGKGIGGKKLDAKKIASEISKKSAEDLGMKPFFRLHPPRGGIDSKVHFPIRHGVLGNHGDKINLLMRRML